jgi:hypothetical protein
MRCDDDVGKKHSDHKPKRQIEKPELSNTEPSNCQKSARYEQTGKKSAGELLSSNRRILIG